MMNLPFLKRRRLPRTQGPIDDKVIGLSADEELESQCIEELMDAVQDKDPTKFRQALEALVMNLFEHEDNDGDE